MWEVIQSQKCQNGFITNDANVIFPLPILSVQPISWWAAWQHVTFLQHEPLTALTFNALRLSTPPPHGLSLIHLSSSSHPVCLLSVPSPLSVHLISFTPSFYFWAPLKAHGRYVHHHLNLLSVLLSPLCQIICTEPFHFRDRDSHCQCKKSLKVAAWWKTKFVNSHKACKGCYMFKLQVHAVHILHLLWLWHHTHKHIYMWPPIQPAGSL